MIIDWEVYPWHGAQSLSLGFNSTGIAIVLEYGSRKNKARIFPDRDIFISEYERPVYKEHKR